MQRFPLAVDGSGLDPSENCSNRLPAPSQTPGPSTDQPDIRIDPDKLVLLIIALGIFPHSLLYLQLGGYSTCI